MDRFEISRTETGLHIEGFPEALKFIGIDGPKAKRLSHLALHRADLEFADECLEAINRFPLDDRVIREALWRSAIVHFFKCFGDSGVRFQIEAAAVLKGEPAEGVEAFEFFKSLRNKHLVHDENSYSQSLPGAVLNKVAAQRKIEKIICLSTTAVTLEQETYGNLKLLVEKSLAWVASQFDKLCEILTAELEARPHAELKSMNEVTYREPTENGVHVRRAP